MSPLEHLTVIYTIKDQKAFDEEWKHIHDLFRSSKDETAFCVTAISRDHEMNRVNLIEEALEKYDDRSACADAIGAIISCPVLSQWTWEKFESGAYD